MGLILVDNFLVPFLMGKNKIPPLLQIMNMGTNKVIWSRHQRPLQRQKLREKYDEGFYRKEKYGKYLICCQDDGELAGVGDPPRIYLDWLTVRSISVIKSAKQLYIYLAIPDLAQQKLSMTKIVLHNK